MVAQKVSSKIRDFDIETDLSIFKRLLEGDYGSYLHFIFFDGDRIFIWASPERNVSITPHISSPLKVDGEHEKYRVRMNPISGTFKKAGYKNYLDFKKSKGLCHIWDSNTYCFHRNKIWRIWLWKKNSKCRCDTKCVLWRWFIPLLVRWWRA